MELLRESVPFLGDALIALERWLFFAELAVQARHPRIYAPIEFISIVNGVGSDVPAGDVREGWDSVIRAVGVLAEVDLDPADGGRDARVFVYGRNLLRNGNPLSSDNLSILCPRLSGFSTPFWNG
ncbi:MAG: hypothetical protein WCI75_20640 [candidate division NC10 bacterium]